MDTHKKQHKVKNKQTFLLLNEEKDTIMHVWNLKTYLSKNIKNVFLKYIGT